ncbi:MAG TPA: LptF/LptG family permease [Gemmatimonadaceae bacterium]|nr:LptF/LptG family permease [Gemmatimonadaceae bacterium]
MRNPLRPLDRYVFGEFWRIFVITALGFPLLVIVIDVTDRLEKYLNRNLTWQQIALSYLYWIPESMFMVMPAAVLFATVFSIGALTRHSEITAAKASGISFHRMVLPIFLGAGLVAVLALALGEVVPITDAKRNEILQEKRYRSGSDRFNFAYSASGGRIYKVASLSVERRSIEGIEIERKGRGAENPTYLLAAPLAQWDSSRKYWTLRNGTLHIVPDSLHNITIRYDSLRDRVFTEAPADLTTSPRAPEEMGFRELGRFIRSLDRSGADSKELKVEQSLKIAIPITCVIIAFFGAPLATSSQRSGAAFGIGISLATTIFFLMLIQLTKAIGQGGVVPPRLAAWLPNFLFGAIGAALLSRVRT